MGMQGVFSDAVDRIGGEPIAARMAKKAPIRHLDPSLLLITLLLSTYGALMIYSATSGGRATTGLDDTYYLKRQLAFMTVGAVVLLMMSVFDYRHLRGMAPIFYVLGLIGLLIVLSPLGEVVQGAKRWIDVGFIQIQPSEMMKLAVIVALAAYLAERRGEVNAGDVAVCVGVVAVPSLLIFFQPDLGSMMVIVAITVAILLVAGARMRHFLVLLLIGGISVFGILQTGLVKDYQKDRLKAFVDPNPDLSSPDAYNLQQSKIAIGSGGMHGKGLQRANTQTDLDYVPEQHTDFIFTAVGEQLGFVGAATLLGFFAFLIWRALRIAAMSRDLFGTLLASGIAALWAFHIFVNVGMTMGIMPITGIPLPFISYGGSSLITNYLAVGLLLNIHMRRLL